METKEIIAHIEEDDREFNELKNIIVDKGVDVLTGITSLSDSSIAQIDKMLEDDKKLLRQLKLESGLKVA